MKLLSVLLIALFPSIAVAELTLQEKAELRKLADASFRITNEIPAIIASGKSPRDAIGTKRSLFVANLLLVHAPSSLLRNEPGAMTREEVVAEAFRHIDNAINVMRGGFPELHDEADLLESIDRSLAYADPLGGIFGMQDDNLPGGDPEVDETQFGPHGSYTKAQQMLGEASRMIQYGQYTARFLNNVVDLTVFHVRLQQAHDCMLRIVNLSAHVSVHKSDDRHVENVVLRSLREINVAQDTCAGLFFGKAVSEMGARIGEAGLLGHSNTGYGVKALSFVSSAWRRLHSWIDTFLQITEVPIS